MTDLSSPAPLFITARFRTGSTMLWNIFRQLSEARVYYEPLHEQLQSYIKNPIEVDRSHFFVKSYFDEYIAIPNAVSLHRSDFANHRLYLESHDSYPELQAYIQALATSVSAGHTAVLQFNRIDLRLAWIRKNFPGARLLHLTRNPRDQWYSTIAGFHGDIDQVVDFDWYSLATWARDLYKDFPFLATPHIRHTYQRFYFIWKLSYIAGQRLSDMSIAYEDILANPKEHLTRMLNLVNLYSDSHLSTCLQIVVSQPERTWKKDRDDNWFQDMEQECEQVLDDLGLNEHFGLMPLSEIKKQSPKYLALLDDPEDERWANTSFRQALAQERSIGVERHQGYLIARQEISSLHQEVDSTRQELDIMRAERDAIGQELDIMRAEQDAISQELASAHQELATTRAERDQLRIELHNVYHSRSWTITAPLRKSTDVLRSVLQKMRRLLAPLGTLPKRIIRFLLNTQIALRLKTRLRQRFPRQWQKLANKFNNTTYSDDVSSFAFSTIPFTSEIYDFQTGHVSEISVDDIMKKIRLEVERVKAYSLQENSDE